MPNYPKMAQLWAKDRVKGDYAKIAKEKCTRYVASTTIDEIDIMVSQNQVSLKNFEVKGDQMRSLENNVVCSWVSSQDAMPSKSKKRRMAEDDELGNESSQSFDSVSMTIDKRLKLWQSALQSHIE